MNAPLLALPWARIVERLQQGLHVFDFDFDRVYPPAIRAVSSSFWTPVAVAMRAAELLAPSPSSRVLDVGSGVGKLCTIGALVTRATFVGVEHRPHFVELAEQSARLLGARGARFLCKDAKAVRIEDYDALYFFNPFEENLWPPEDRLDASVQLSPARYEAEVLQTERLLDAAPTGVRVVTYHGFGGKMPSSYRLLRSEYVHTGRLELWTKVTAEASAVP